MQALTFRDTQFEIINRDGQPWLQGAQIACALGYANEDAVSRIYRRNADEFTPCMTETVKLTVSGNLQKEVRIFSLRGAHLLAMFARTKVAKEFRHWVLDVLEGVVKAPVPSKAKNPKSLPSGLTTDQQGALKALVAARIEALPELERGRAATRCWSALKSRFGCGYKEIAPERFTEAVSLVARIVLEGELLEPEAPKMVGRLDIDYPIEDWKARNPQQFRHDNPNSPDLVVGYGDLLSSDYSPCCDLLDKLHNAGYRVDGAFYELRSYQNLMLQMDMTLRSVASSIKGACDSFEQDRRRFQKYVGVKGHKI
ncbi:hypothetical protein E0E54_00725 [Azotobacter chroococcum]|uniref:BRO-N domain-containing protein n=1 Tax=Azotobacter chroococcum TaxID=353 RepID=UPI00103E25DD|nr:BRO family protein [Azotobacter chroococcum]TBW40135.1 hypothetical protein E0E54_00725 [Azotobacter chroococcum]